MAKKMVSPPVEEVLVEEVLAEEVSAVVLNVPVPEVESPGHHSRDLKDKN